MSWRAVLVLQNRCEATIAGNWVRVKNAAVDAGGACGWLFVLDSEALTLKFCSADKTNLKICIY